MPPPEISPPAEGVFFVSSFNGVVMILNLKSIEENCEEFFNLYAIADEKARVMCKRKHIHTQEVAKNSLYIANALNLSKYDQNIAWTIGYLHDFARFGQAVVTQTFKDSEAYNHAHNGTKLLFQHGMIEGIIDNYDDISDEDKILMEKAIYHHGDLILPVDLTEREKLFCDIIREADKIDIFRAVVTTGYETMYGASKEEIAQTDISAEIESAFYNRATADYKKRKTPADFLLAHQALFFGLNMKAGKIKVIKDGYLKKMMDITFLNPKTQERYVKIKKCLEAEFEIGKET